MWRFLKRAFTRDIPLKLSSAGLAVLIMLFILVARMEPRTFQGVPVRIVDVPSNMLLRDDWKPSRVDLTMRGPRVILDEVKGKVSVEVSMAGASPGHHQIQLSAANVKIDIPSSHRKRVQVDSKVSDWQVQCNLEMYTRELPVETPAVEGIPQPPYYCDSSMLEVRPTRVMVTAPKAILDRLEEEQRELPLHTVAVNVDGVNQEVLHRHYRVNFEALNVEPVYPTDREVVVTIQLERSDHERELTVGRVEVRNLPEGAQSDYSTEPITAVVEGRQSLVEALEPNQLTAWLDASLVLGATDYVPIAYEVVAPAEMKVRVKSWKPETIKLKITGSTETKGGSATKAVGKKGEI